MVKGSCVCGQLTFEFNGEQDGFVSSASGPALPPIYLPPPRLDTAKPYCPYGAAG